MAQDNEYVQKLIAARDREVTHRRDIAEALAEKHNRGDTENMREAFIKIQDVIEAIERLSLAPSAVRVSAVVVDGTCYGLKCNGSTIDSRLATSQVPPKLREGPDRGEPRTRYQETLR
jgi:hypothetical protein